MGCQLYPIPKTRPAIYIDFGVVVNPVGNMTTITGERADQFRFIQALEMAQFDLLINVPHVTPTGELFANGGFQWTGLRGSFVFRDYDDYNSLILQMVRFTLDPNWLTVSACDTQYFLN